MVQETGSLVNEGHQSKDLGPLVKHAGTVAVWRKIMPQVWVSGDNDYFKIEVDIDIVGAAKEVEVTPQPHLTLLGKEEGQQRDNKLDRLPSILWSQHDTDVGKIRIASPVEIKLKKGAVPPRRPQYPLKLEAEEGIAPTIQGLLEAEVLKRTDSPCNTPLLPVLKGDKSKWRLVHDLRAVNEVVEDWPAVVPNPHTLLTNVPPEADYFSVIDLCSAFFSVHLADQCQYLFAFTYRDNQYTYTRMPQGFKYSPHVFNQELKADLEGISLESTLIQYVYDLLICSESEGQCEQDTITLLERLAHGGHKVSRKKLQFCKQQVEYLGRVISKGAKAIAPDQIEAITKAPKPQTEAGHTSLRSNLQWNEEAEVAFNTIKQELQSAPALALPDYEKAFHLYVSNRQEGYAAAVLTQETGTGKAKQPIAYYSAKLDEVAQRYPPCYQGLAALYYAYEKASSVTMGYPVILYTHHKVAELLERGKFVLTPARIAAYQMLLTFPDITIQRCTTSNISDYVPLGYEGEPHVCVRKTMTFTKLRADLRSAPLEDEDKKVLFVDGSCYRDHDGNHAGFSVLQQDQADFKVIRIEACPQPCSVQLAEIRALTAACEMMEGEKVDIYTDSAYAHGVCHLFGAVWKQRGFKKSNGDPIQHCQQILDLIKALMKPKALAIVKCQAHKKGNDAVTKGNQAADEAARKASGCTSAVIAPQEKQKEPEIDQGEGPIQPGDQVYVPVFRRKWNKPRREGPFTVTKASPTAVQVEGRSTWYHLNHCTRAIPQVVRWATRVACSACCNETVSDTPGNCWVEPYGEGGPMMYSYSLRDTQDEQERDEICGD
ncbi:uncharacterized protein LOC134347311 [Mobula hypostoma]|uniref:uncharacterized protein LOC134347311 n=1 Tax=Mobula hypostoma TaxID=723540 RepID=UPI002FC2C0B6